VLLRLVFPKVLLLPIDGETRDSGFRIWTVYLVAMERALRKDVFVLSISPDGGGSIFASNIARPLGEDGGRLCRRVAV